MSYSPSHLACIALYYVLQGVMGAKLLSTITTTPSRTVQLAAGPAFMLCWMAVAIYFWPETGHSSMYAGEWPTDSAVYRKTIVKWSVVWGAMVLIMMSPKGGSARAGDSLDSRFPGLICFSLVANIAWTVPQELPVLLSSPCAALRVLVALILMASTGFFFPPSAGGGTFLTVFTDSGSTARLPLYANTQVRE